MIMYIYMWLYIYTWWWCMCIYIYDYVYIYILYIYLNNIYIYKYILHKDIFYSYLVLSLLQHCFLIFFGAPKNSLSFQANQWQMGYWGQPQPTSENRLLTLSQKLHVHSEKMWENDILMDICYTVPPLYGDFWKWTCWLTHNIVV